MNRPRMNYFEEEDILHLVISDEKEANSVELSSNVTAELVLVQRELDRRAV